MSARSLHDKKYWSSAGTRNARIMHPKNAGGEYLGDTIRTRSFIALVVVMTDQALGPMEYLVEKTLFQSDRMARAVLFVLIHVEVRASCVLVQWICSLGFTARQSFCFFWGGGLCRSKFGANRSILAQEKRVKPYYS